MCIIEVLAPCGNRENLKVAIESGADAVYLGVSQFNARVGAENFTIDNLVDVVEECHLYGVKVYLTVNIIIKEEEYGELKKLVWVAKDAKVDAYIVQDLGVAAIIKEIDCDGVLHASTQLGVHNLQGAKVIERLGFSRVVVSRETTIADIRAISKGTNLEIESFVQGALCVSFSGGCYLSSVHNGNSGNRGRCQQLCRLPIKAVGKGKLVKEGYLLSASDLCYAESVQRLINAGVTSLKIEGRMRSSLYVAEAVRLYKNILADEEYNTAGIAVAYNRGAYNQGAYFENKSGQIINANNQNHIGTHIGEVVSVKPFKDLFEIVLTSTRELHKGDGLKFFDGNREVASAGVGNIYNNKSTYKIYSKAKVQAGNSVSIIFDSNKRDEFVAESESYKINCDIYARIEAGNPLQVKFSSMGVSVTETSDYIVPKSITKITTAAEIMAQLSKMNDTKFAVGSIVLHSDDIFIPKSILNALRRAALIKLESKIKAEYTRKTSKKVEFSSVSAQIEQPVGNIFVVDSLAMAQKIVAENNGGILSIKPQEYTKDAIDRILEKCAFNEEKWSFALELPTYSSGLDMQHIENLLVRCNKITTLIVNNIGGLQFLEKGYTIIAGSGLNIISSHSAAQLTRLGVSAIIASTEFRSNISETKHITHAYKFGKLGVMTLRHCPFKVVYGGDCNKCKFHKDLSYIIEGREYRVVRTVLNQCQFALRSSECFQNNSVKLGYFDLCGVEACDYPQMDRTTSSYFKKNLN